MEWFAPPRLHETWWNDFQPKTDLLCLEVIMPRWALGFFIGQVSPVGCQCRAYLARQSLSSRFFGR